MQYMTGIFALNIPCELETGGDWHFSSLNWDIMKLSDTKDSLFKEYGIEYKETVFNKFKNIYVANHIRALLDLLDSGNFSLAQGMNKDFICNSKYDEEIFCQVAKMKGNQNWKEVDLFMGKEYMSKWLNFKKGSICSES